jgi:hypothetical protein
MAGNLTHGRVDLCNCHGQSGRKPAWKGEGHADDCPARQPDFDLDAHTVGAGEYPVHGKAGKEVQGGR